jgi:hypothetical protein
MKFEKIIGQKFEQISSNLESFEIENNEFELELEEGLEERYFVTAKNGLFEMILSKEKIVNTIFIYPDENGVFNFQDCIVKMGKNEILKRFGKPDKLGGPISNSIIGESGGFHRFDRDLSYHFEYRDDDQTELKKITLMSLETAP